MNETNEQERFYTASPGCPEYRCSSVRRMTGLLWEQPGLAVCDHMTQSALDANQHAIWSDGAKVDGEAGIFIRVAMDIAAAGAAVGDDIVLGLCRVIPGEERLCACVALREAALIAVDGGLANA